MVCDWMLDALIGFAGLILLVFPGWLLARSTRLRLPVLMGFLGALLALVTVVLTLQLSGRRLSPLNVAVVWAAWILTTGLLSRRLAARPMPNLAPPPASPRPLWPWWIIAPVIAAVGFRCFARPLFGADTHFRWGFLAEQMWLRETLSFYPPVTAAGLEVYAWPDGIPPIVSSAYFGLYCLAGKVEPALTGPLTAVQFVLLLVAVAALAEKFFSPAAGAWAIALLGVTSIAAWSTTMGQETGLIALAVVGLFFHLPRTRDEETPAAMFAAGVCVSVAALAREYGWAFAVIGFTLAARRRLSPHGLLTMATVFTVTTIPWYLRNWVLSGNPFFNLGTVGLFPVNGAHAALMSVYREHFAFLKQVDTGFLFALGGLLAILVTGIAGAVRRFSEVRPIIVTILVSVAVWLASVAYTAGGFSNALRVLNPALALAAVLGGAWLAGQTTTVVRQRVVAIVLVAFGIDAAIRTLTLPDYAYRLSRAEWFTVDVPPADYQVKRRAAFQAAADTVRSNRLVALGGNTILTRLGVAAVPPWSPDIAFLFDPAVDPQSAWRRLRDLHYSHVLVSKGDVNREYLLKSRSLSSASTEELRPVINVDEFVLFAIVAP